MDMIPIAIIYNLLRGFAFNIVLPAWYIGMQIFGMWFVYKDYLMKIAFVIW